MSKGSGAELCFRATVLPHKIGMPGNIFCKFLFRNRNYAHGKITRQEKQLPSAYWVDPIMWYVGVEHTVPPGWPLSGSDDDRPLLADSRPSESLSQMSTPAELPTLTYQPISARSLRSTNENAPPPNRSHPPVSRTASAIPIHRFIIIQTDNGGHFGRRFSFYLVSRKPMRLAGSFLCVSVWPVRRFSLGRGRRLGRSRGRR